MLDVELLAQSDRNQHIGCLSPAFFLPPESVMAYALPEL